MRLWHKDLIPFLPRQQLLGQWRECCLIAKNLAERGTPNHVLVNKVMLYPDISFDRYAADVQLEMHKRGYKADAESFMKWRKPHMEGLAYSAGYFIGWHNDRYLRQCLANLQEKYDCGAIPAEEWKRITDRWPEWR